MGAAWETIGFAFKTLGSRDQQNTTYVILGQLFFLLAPLCKHFQCRAVLWDQG